MDPVAVLARLREEQRSLAWPGERLEILPGVTRRCLDGRWHIITYSDLSAENADRVVSDQIEHYNRLHAEVEWKVFGSDEPPDLVRRLANQGFDVGPQEAVVLYDLADGMEGLKTSTDCLAERLTQPNQIDAYRAVAEEIFEKDYSRTSAELEEALVAGSTHHAGYLGTLAGEPAAIGRLYTNPDSAFGGLYGGGTLKRFRGRGCYRALIAARARDARKLGTRYLLVDALPTSLPILLRLGFVHVTDTWPCVWRPSEPAPTP